MRGRFGFSAVRGTQRKLPVGIPAGGVTQPDPGVTSTIDPTLTPPVLSLTTGNLVYPPQLSAALDDTPDAAVPDQLCLQIANDNGFTAGVVTQLVTLDAATAAAHSATFPGLAVIAAGTHRYRACTIHNGARSNWSNVITQGPDDIAPVLSALSSALVGPTAGNVSVATNEPGKIYVLLTTTNAAPTQLAVVAGQTNVIATPGAQVLPQTGLTAGTPYWAWVVGEDATGNRTAVTAAPGPDAGGSFTTASVAPVGHYQIHKFATQNVGFSNNTAAFAGGAIGAARADRVAIACVESYDGGTNAPSGVSFAFKDSGGTVVGTAAGVIVGAQQGHMSMWRAAPPATAVTVDVTVTLPANIGWAACELETITTFTAAPVSNVASAWPGGAGAPSATPTVNANQLAVAFVAKDSAGLTPTWVNATGRTSQNDLVWSSGIATAAATAAVSVSNFGGAQNGIIIGVWGP